MQDDVELLDLWHQYGSGRWPMILNELKVRRHITKTDDQIKRRFSHLKSAKSYLNYPFAAKPLKIPSNATPEEAIRIRNIEVAKEVERETAYQKAKDLLEKIHKREVQTSSATNYKENERMTEIVEADGDARKERKARFAAAMKAADEEQAARKRLMENAEKRASSLASLNEFAKEVFVNTSNALLFHLKHTNELPLLSESASAEFTLLVEHALQNIKEQKKKEDGRRASINNSTHASEHVNS